MSETRRCCEQIDDFLDRDMNEDESERFWQSASDCDACRRILSQQSVVDRRIRESWSQVEWRGRHEPTVETQAKSQRVGWNWRQVAFVAATCASIAILLVGRWSVPPLAEPKTRNVAQPSGQQSERETNSTDADRYEIEKHVYQLTDVVVHGNAIGVPLDEFEDMTVVVVYKNLLPVPSKTDSQGEDQ